MSNLSWSPGRAEHMASRAAEISAQLGGCPDGSDGEANELRRELVLLYLPTADALARRFHIRGHDHQDLVQVARLGLIEASQRFDPDRGAFGAFASSTVTGVIKRYFRDHAWFVRPPRRLQENAALITRTSEQLSRELARRPLAAEIAEAAGLTLEDVYESRIVALSFEPTSIYGTSPESDVELERHVGVDDGRFAAVDVALTVHSACAQLNHADQELVYLRFVRQLSQQEIADKFGVSQMQVSRWQRRVLTSLREAMGNDLEMVG